MSAGALTRSRRAALSSHATTAAAVDFIRAQHEGVAATLTPQHLLMNRNWLFQGGLRPHHYCLPVLKRERDRRALLDAVAAGDPRFFLGTDSAPHSRSAKEAACGCAGIYSAHAALELYAEAFEQVAALSRLEAFASEFGPRFYGLPLNEGTVTLERIEWQVPDSFGSVACRMPLRALPLGWRLRAQLKAGVTPTPRLFDGLPAPAASCMAMSHPESRPSLTAAVGGQFENLQLSRRSRSSNTYGDTRTDVRSIARSAEKPHCGKSGVPFRTPRLGPRGAADEFQLLPWFYCPGKCANRRLA